MEERRLLTEEEKETVLKEHIKKDWDGSWDSERGKEIAAKIKKDSDFLEFRNKIKNWILDKIIIGITVIYAIMMIIWVFLPTTSEGDSTHFYDLVKTVIAGFKALSPFTQVIFIITIIWIFVCCIIFASYEIEKEDS